VRDIAGGKARFAAVTFLVFLGTALFLSNWLSYRSLDHSYREAGERLKYNDVVIEVAGAPDSVAGELRSMEGVKAVLPRLELEGGGYLPGGADIVCRLIGLPTEERPAVNDVLVEKGRYFVPGEEGACLPEVHLADFYDLEPGDSIQVMTPRGKTTLDVVGSAASAEFFIVSTRKEMIASPRNYGVLFVPQSWLQEAFGLDGESNVFCFLVEEGGDASTVMAEAEKALSPYKILYASLGDETEARQLLDLDVEGFREMAVFFPLLFLVVAALSIYMILVRMVHMQRKQVGAMMALGLGRRRIAFHYLSYALLVGLVGAAAGLTAGYFLAGSLTGMYAERLGIPLVFTVMDWTAVGEGLFLAVAACCLAAIVPVRRLVRRVPAELMREEGGESRAMRRYHVVLERIFPPVRRLSLAVRMPLRNVWRDRRRTLLNLMGIVFSLLLIVVALALVDSINAAFSFQFDDFTRYDAKVFYVSPRPREEAPDLDSSPAVQESAPFLESPCRFSLGADTLGEGLLDVLPRGTDLLGLYDLDGKRVELPGEGVLLSGWFKEGLGLREGEELLLETGSGSFRVRVEGFVKQLGGLTAFADLDWFRRKTGLDEVNGALVKSSGPQGEELRDELLKVEGVSGVELPAFTREMMREELMGMMFVFSGLIVLFAAAMALALIYNTVNIAYLEREGEVSIMLALGSGVGRLAGMFTLENLAVGSMALLPGLAAGYILAVVMMKTFSNQFFSARVELRGISCLAACLGVLAVILLAEIPSLHRASRLDLASAVKRRSG
jgi:putative ABC transport system permease protein